MNPNNFTRPINTLIRDTGFQRIRVHDLRHTSARLMPLKGMRTKLVSERLGHASISITLDLYSHVWPDMHKHAASAMDRIFERAFGSA